MTNELERVKKVNVELNTVIEGLYKNISDLENKLTDEENKSYKLEEALSLISWLDEQQSWTDLENYGTPKEIALRVLTQVAAQTIRG